MSDDTNDPFRRRDTRSFLGKSERRESPREQVQAEVLLVGSAAPEGDQKPTTEKKIASLASVSLNGVFFQKDDCEEALGWIDKKAEIKLHLPHPDGDPEVIKISGIFQRPSHRDDGVLIRFDDLSFESERALARFLDEKSIC